MCCHMGIKFVTGTSGSGKTLYARNRAAQLAFAGRRTALLVPEQFSFVTERAMLQLLPSKLVEYVEVFSFTKLAGKVARETGGIAGKRLDHSGRAAVMNVAMTQVQDHLSLFAGSRKRHIAAAKNTKGAQAGPVDRAGLNFHGAIAP